jgi:hypothetical protein
MEIGQALRKTQELATKDEYLRRQAIFTIPSTDMDTWYSIRSNALTPRLMVNQNLQAVMVQSGIEFGLFRHLTGSNKPVTVD